MRSRVVSNGIEREREKWREPDCISSSLFVQTQVSVFLPCPDMTCRARPFPYETLVSAPIFKKRNRLVLSFSLMDETWPSILQHAASAGHH